MKSMPPQEEMEDEFKVGQRVVSLLTGIEYEIKKMLKDNNVLLLSTDQNASALVHKNHMKTFYMPTPSPPVNGFENESGLSKRPPNHSE